MVYSATAGGDLAQRPDNAFKAEVVKDGDHREMISLWG